MEFLTKEEQEKIMNGLSERINAYLKWKLPEAHTLTGAFYLSFGYKNEAGGFCSWYSDYSIGEGTYIGDLLKHLSKYLNGEDKMSDRIHSALKETAQAILDEMQSED